MPEPYRSTIRGRGLVRAAAAVVACLLISSGIAIWLLRQDALADAVADNHRLGVVLAEQTTRTVQAADFVLQELSGKIIDSGASDLASLHERFGSQDLRDALTRRLDDLPQVVSFIIADSAGRLVNITGPQPGPDWSVADRPYFRHFATTQDAGPYISEPAVGRASGLSSVFLVRRITAPDGAFLGVLIAPLRLEYFSEFFVKSGFSDGAGVSIFRQDGLVLVHFPGPPVPAGQRVPAKFDWYNVVAAGGGHYTSSGVFADLGPILVSVHPLKTYPLVLDFTRSQAAALSRWWRQASVLALGVLAATLSLTLLLRALTRQIAISEASQEQVSQQVIAVQASQRLVANTLEHMNQGLIMVDGEGKVAVCNQRALELMDLPAEMMAASPRWVDVIDYLLEQGEFVGSQAPMAADNLFNAHASYEHRRPNGTVVEIRAAPLPEGGQVRTYTDVTARAAAEEMLGLAASHDHLTGLANRNGFNSRLDAALTAAQRGQTGLAVLCLDLDRFKLVNDTLGHGAGDQLLIQAAQRMRDIARKSDVIGRLGGDEFAIVLPGSDQAGAEHLSQRLLESIRMPYILGEETARIGVSIGITIYPADGGFAEELLQKADTALYQAKAAGRNTWRTYASEDSDRETRRVSLERDFRAAIELRQFSVVYQPICDGASGLPVAFEALLRWNHPERGNVSPSEFIPVAEQTGLIVPLGRWVIEVACAEAAAWALPLRVAVNLSPVQFCDHHLLDFITDVLSRTGLTPDRLDLEVTEGLLLEETADVIKTMQALREMGIRMVLDDFGTAHSNLSYLRGFPFAAVKIDRSFLRALNSDQQARALVEAMLAMARALDLDVIGEGVETPEQLTLLTHLQCRWVQGYLLGRPASGAETSDRIRQLTAPEVPAEMPPAGCVAG